MFLGLGIIEGHRRRGGGSKNSDFNDRMQEIQLSVDSLRTKLQESDLRDLNEELLALTPHTDSNMKHIISR